MISIVDIAFVRYRAPDLDEMQAFLEDFGMHLSARTDDALYMRGYGKAHHVHVTERGEAASLGFGFWASSRADLTKLAAEVGSVVEDNPEPGGGERVRFTDPAGFTVDVLYGQQELAPIDHRESHQVNGAVGQRTRRSNPVRTQLKPSHVMRLGHVVIMPENYKETFEFYSRLFNLKVSDGYYTDGPDKPFACFMHLDSPEAWVDHHCLALITAEDGRVRIDHSAFEVLDIDDIYQGHAYLSSKGRNQTWGVGRHVQGSQVFDYWRDPVGHKIEHWTDGDLVNNDYPENHGPASPEGLYQWGPAPQPAFFE